MTAHGFTVVAAVASGPELRRALAEEELDVAVVDVRLPPTFTDEGMQAALEARRERPGLPVLVLSQHVEQLYARELLGDGAGGSDTCSKTGCSAPRSSWNPYDGWRAAAPRWTRRS